MCLGLEINKKTTSKELTSLKMQVIYECDKGRHSSPLWAGPYSDCYFETVFI